MGYYEFTSDENIIEPSHAKKNSIFIFDDVSTQKQAAIRDYFCMGRHCLVDYFYLTQTYTHVPKHLLRDSANVIICFRQDSRNARNIYNDHAAGDMSWETFEEICRKCWQDRYSFLSIFKDSELNNGRYRKMFDVFIKVA